MRRSVTRARRTFQRRYARLRASTKLKSIRDRSPACDMTRWTLVPSRNARRLLHGVANGRVADRRDVGDPALAVARHRPDVAAVVASVVVDPGGLTGGLEPARLGGPTVRADRGEADEPGDDDAPTRQDGRARGWVPRQEQGACCRHEVASYARSLAGIYWGSHVPLCMVTMGSSCRSSGVGRAEVAELADAQASGACGRKVVEVRVLSSAPAY